MKQAKIKIDVTVEIRDVEENLDGSKTAPARVYTNFKETLADLLFEAGEAHREREGFNKILEQYVYLRILDEVGVPFTPLTTEEALKLKDCEIVEAEE